MVWHEKYWDAVDQFYWNPSLLGLPSVPKSQWGDDPSFIQVDRNRVKNGGSIYARKGTSKENAARMRGLEEPLNHIFDITFGIAADCVVARLIHKHLNIDDEGPFERLGREVQQRFGWGGANVTQQDGFYVSPRSAVGVELKVKSRTWPLQTLKYLALMVAEERCTGRKSELGILYITPSSDVSSLWRGCGASAQGRLDGDFIKRCEGLELNATLRNQLSESRSAFEDVARRVRLRHISWKNFVGCCAELAATLEQENAGEATLKRLLEGFCKAVGAHAGTGLEAV